MGIFDNFPYTNFHELNLDWILKMLQQIDKTMSEFVAINALKYADPIQWSIIRQYEKNTIVIDPLTGTAYISVQPVPAGVAITNTDYWTVVFDLGAFVVRASKNFAAKYEDATTLTATFPSSVNDWLIWGDVLYKVISPIVAGDQYVVDSNIKHFTMEDLVGHLEDLTTTDKSNVVAAINEVLQKLINTAGDLDDLSTTDKSNLVAAINEVVTELGITNTNIGDISNLITTDNTNLVVAINENAKRLNQTLILNVKDYGAVGNGLADDTQAFQNCINDLQIKGCTMYIPGGRYLITDTLHIGESWIIIEGQGDSSVIYTNTDFGNIFDFVSDRAEYTQGVVIRDLRFIHDADLSVPARTSGAAIRFYGVNRSMIENVSFFNEYMGISIEGGAAIDVSKCYFTTYHNFSGSNGRNYAGISLTNVTDAGFTGIAVPTKISLYKCCGNGNIENGVNTGANYGYIICGGEQVEVIACEFSNCRQSNLGIVQIDDGYSLYEVEVIGGYYDCAGENGIRIVASNNANYGIFNTRLDSVVIKASGQVGSFDGLYVYGGNRPSGTFQYGVSGLQISNCVVSMWNRSGMAIEKAYDTIIGNCLLKGSGLVISGAGVNMQNSKRFNICNNIIGGAGELQNTGTQDYAIVLGNGCTDFIIQNNDVKDNNITPIFDGSGVDGEHKRINNNLGYNEATYNGIVTMPTPANDTYVYNPTGTPILLSIIATTQTMNISLNDQYLYTGVANAMFVLGAGDRFKIAYDPNDVPAVLYWKI